MTLVATFISIRSVEGVSMPVAVPSDPGDPPWIVADGYRYRSLGSLQALGLAAVASVALCALLWLVL